MKKFGGKTSPLEAAFNTEDFLHDVEKRIVGIVEKGQEIDEEFVVGSVPVDTGRLLASVRKFKVRKTTRQIYGLVRMGGKNVDGEPVDYGWAVEMRSSPMRVSAKAAGPAIRAYVATLPVL